MQTSRGIDVSSHQGPIHWDRMDISWAYIRATYGTRPDRMTTTHVAGVRGAGKGWGLYHFFRPDQGVAEQLAAFAAQANACEMGLGELLPALDVEAYPAAAGSWIQPNGHWMAPLEQLLEAFRSRWGGPVLYISASIWVRLGKPSSLLEHPLWVANWPLTGGAPLAKPHTPGGADWAFWQYLVCPFGQARQNAGARGAVDHDLGREPLLRIRQPFPGVLEAPPKAPSFSSLDEPLTRR